MKDLFFTSNSFKYESFKNIAFQHCFSGYDATSGFAEKKTIVNSLLDNKNLVNIFYKKDDKKEDTAINGSQLIKSIYKCKNKNIVPNN